VLYAPLSVRQREVYDAVVKGSLRGLLAGSLARDPVKMQGNANGAGSHAR